MNTKQLWNALINNKVTEPFFDGIFPRDMLTIIENKPQLIICNTDPSFKKGEHWILFFFGKNFVEFMTLWEKVLTIMEKSSVN